MKRIITSAIFTLSLILYYNAKAQECTGGGFVCTPNAAFTTEGFQPSDTNLPCAIDGVYYDTVIQVHTPASVEGYTLDHITVLSITNLPCGLCWEMSSTTINGNSTQCIRIKGTTYDAPGQYGMVVSVDAYVNIGIVIPAPGNPYNLSSFGLAYYLRVQLPSGVCAPLDTGTGLTAHPSGTIRPPTISGNTILCPGGSTTLSASGSNYYGYVWSNGTNGASALSITVTTPGTYTVMVFDSCNSATASTSVTVYSPTDTALGATTFCQGGNVVLSASAGQTYHWSNGITSQHDTVTQGGSYTVTISNSSGCSVTGNPIAVTVNPLPDDTVTASGPTSFCQGGSVVLSAAAGLSSYHWSNGKTTQNDTITTGGTYTVTVSNSNNCTAVSTGIVVTVNSNPTATVTASGATTFCQGGNVILSAPSGLTYNWSNGITTQNDTVTQGGNYTVTVSTGSGCTAVSSGTTVTANPLPDDTVTTGGPTSFCQGGSVVLSAPPGLTTYHWSNGKTTQNDTVTTGNTYTVTVSNSNSCTAVSSGTLVTVNSNPGATVTPSGPTAFCQGGNVILSAPSGLTTYNWSNGKTTQNDTITTGSTYTVTVSNSNSCTAVSSGTTVTVNSNPVDTVTAGGPTSFCPGGSVVLSAPSGFTYNWSNGKSTQNDTATQSGSYTVTVSNGNGCTAVSSGTQVTVYSNPNNTVTASGSTTFCQGGSVVLSAPAGLSTYNWSNGVTTQNDTITQGANYSVTVSNSNSCTAVSSGTLVTVYSNPGAAVTLSGPTSFCQGGRVILSAPSGLTTYNWSNGITTQNDTATQTGNYTVTVSNSNGCTAVSSGISVTANPFPDATVTPGGPTTFCQGGNVVLSAAAGLTYHWSNGTSTQNDTVTQNGNYTVTVSNSNGCTAVSSPTAVTVNATTSIGIQPVSQSTCVGGNVTFNVTASGTNLSYTWLKNDTATGVTTQSYNIPSAAVSDTGSYSVIVTGTCGADTSQAATLSVTNSITISQQPVSQSACLGSSVTFSVIANGANATFLWQKNGVTAGAVNNLSSYTINSVSTTDTGSYSCSITSSCGDTTSANALLTVKFPTSFSYTQAICAGSSYNFNGQTLTVGGTYYDTLTAANGCDSAVTLTLTVNSVLSSSYSASICTGSSYPFNGQLLTSSGQYYDTLLTTGGCDSVVTLNLTVNQPSYDTIQAGICAGSSYPFNGQSLTLAGSYNDTLTNTSNCDSIVTLVLTINQPSYDTVPAVICAGDSFFFNGQNYGAAGNYNDTLTNAANCDSIVTLALTVNQPSYDTIPAAICAGDSYPFNGQNYSVAGNYNDTLTNANNCDSIVTLALVVNQPSYDTVYAAICAGDNYPFNGQNYSAAGDYNETLTNVNNCDSIVTLVLTVNQPSYDTIYATICAGDNYPFNGQLDTTTGYYNENLTNASNCDSIITLVLTVNQPSYDTIPATICDGDSVTFNGHAYRSTGTYNDTLTAANSCDSIVTLALIVTQPARDTVYASICAGGTYPFNGQLLDSAGDYNDTVHTANACDSLITTLTLIVNQPSFDTVYASFCNGSGYPFGGQIYTSPGSYNDTLANIYTCDSIVTLVLSVNQPSYDTVTATICQGDSFTFNGQIYSAPGDFNDTLTNANNCDSIVTLALVVNPSPATPDITQHGDTLVSTTAAAYQWYRSDTLISAISTQQIVVTQNGLYSVVITDNNGCHSTSAIDTVVLTGIMQVGNVPGVEVFPNPTTGMLNIRLTGLTERDPVSIKVYNEIGQLIIDKTENISAGGYNGQVNLNDESKGLYLLQVKQAGWTVSHRIILTK